MIEVSHFGIHWAQGYAFLEQQKPRKVRHDRFEPTGTNALGLPIKSPFIVKPLNHLRCPHLIPTVNPRPDIDQWEPFKALYEQSPLVRAMSPCTPGISFFIDSQVPRLVPQLLSQMCSPTVPAVFPVPGLSPILIAKHLAITNLQPLILMGVTPKDTKDVTYIVEAAIDLPRPLVIIGRSDVVLPKAVIRNEESGLSEDDVEIMAQMPWQTIGAAVVRHFMRKESFV